MSGLALATVMLAGCWMAATASLLAQDVMRDGARLAATRPQDKSATAKEHLRDRVFARGIRQYARRDFHPSQNDVDDLARAFLAEAQIS
jgi:predicted metal-dependent hydrolase